MSKIVISLIILVLIISVMLLVSNVSHVEAWTDNDCNYSITLYVDGNVDNSSVNTIMYGSSTSIDGSQGSYPSLPLSSGGYTNCYIASPLFNIVDGFSISGTYYINGNLHHINNSVGEIVECTVNGVSVSGLHIVFGEDGSTSYNSYYNLYMYIDIEYLNTTPTVSTTININDVESVYSSSKTFGIVPISESHDSTDFDDYLINGQTYPFEISVNENEGGYTFGMNNTASTLREVNMLQNVMVNGAYNDGYNSGELSDGTYSAVAIWKFTTLPNEINITVQSQSYKYTYPVSIVSGVLTNKTVLFNGFSINGNNPNPVETFTSPPSTYILSGQDYIENVTSLKLLFNDTYITTTTDTLNLEVNLRVVIDGVLYEVFNGYETSFDMSQFVFGETGITINSSNYSFYQDFIAEFEGSYITSAQMQVEALQNGNYRYTINVYMESRLWSDNYYSGAIVLVKDIFLNVMDVLSVDILPNISVLDIFGVVVFVGFAFFIFKLLGY